MSNYTFSTSTISPLASTSTTTTPSTTINNNEFNPIFSAESVKKYPELCRNGTKGTVLLIVSGVKEFIYDNGKATGFHWKELIVPFEEFSRAGYNCVVTSESGQCYADEKSIDIKEMGDKHDVSTYQDKLYPVHALLKEGNLIKANELLLNDKWKNFVGVYGAGGHGCMYDLPHAKHLKTIIANIYENGGVIGSVCHNPSIFQHLLLSNGKPLIEGKKVTGFSTSLENKFISGILEEWKSNGIMTVEEGVNKMGGIWQEPTGTKMDEYVIKDGKLVTGVNPASAKKLAMEMIEMLDSMMKTGGVQNYDSITQNIHKEQLNLLQNEYDKNNNHKNLSDLNHPVANQEYNKVISDHLESIEDRNAQPYEFVNKKLL